MPYTKEQLLFQPDVHRRLDGLYGAVVNVWQFDKRNDVEEISSETLIVEDTGCPAVFVSEDDAFAAAQRYAQDLTEEA